MFIRQQPSWIAGSTARFLTMGRGTSLLTGHASEEVRGQRSLNQINDLRPIVLPTMSRIRVVCAVLLACIAVFVLAGGAEAQPASTSFTITDVMIPVSDSIDLHGRLYRPDRIADGRPAIFAMTPYGVDDRHGYGTYFARRGYVFLNVDVRGRGASEGTFWPFVQDGPDGAAVADWITRQPWSNGKVAMRGGSYRGVVQWQVLAEAPGALQTAVPTAAPYPGWNTPHLYVITGASWLAGVQGRALHRSLRGDAKYWTRKLRELHRSGRPYEDVDEITGISSRIFERWLEHPYFDDYWKAPNPDSAGYRRVNMPLLSVTGYFDFFNRGTLRYYREHMEHGSEQSTRQHYLLIGPWDHGGTRQPETEVGGLTFADTAAIDITGLTLQWYDWTLREGPKPEMLKDRVVYYVMEKGQWRSAPSLEAATDTSRQFYLQSPGKNPSDPFNAGQLIGKVPETEDTDQYVYDPRETADFATLQTMDGDYTAPGAAFLEGPKLIYHSRPVNESFELTGQMRLDAWIELNVPDTDMGAWVYEIRATGKTIYLGHAKLRARHRYGVDSVALAEPGRIERYRFDRFNWTARQIKRGSRIRLVIAPVNDPAWQKNYNSGGPPMQESVEDAQSATVTLHIGPEYPSKLVLPVRSGESDAQTESSADPTSGNTSADR